MRSPDLSYISDVYLHFGAIRVLPELQHKFGMTRPLIVTDRGVVECGLLDQLHISAAAVFDRVVPNPTQSCAVECLEHYRSEDCDSLIAFGGGSPIDLAKCVALMVHHEPPLEQYAIVHGGPSKIRAAIPPLIAIPTTAGSGSEVGRAALLTLSSGDKLGFLSPHLAPKAAICDPELTLTVPPQLTAGTGMDAISHCMEAFCSTKENPVADAIALDGLGRGYRNIEISFRDPLNRAARSEMMICSLEGGLSFQKGLGAVHSLSHPLGGLTERRLHHGTLNAIFLPHVLRFNYEFCAEKMDRMARTIGLGRGIELPEAIQRLNQRLGLPANLSAVGLTRSDIEPLAEKAVKDHCTPTNPRPLDRNTCLQLYLEALTGFVSC